MQKFNPEKELSKIQTNNFNKKSNFKGMFLPLLLIGCSIMAITTASFSANMVGDIPVYNIDIEIINGPIDSYYKRVSNGPFVDKIETNSSFASIKCNEGTLDYDIETGTISNPDIRGNIACVLSFANDGTKTIKRSELKSINDNTGVSYYFKGDSTNNYIEIDGDMFRIVRINGDGSLRLISESTYIKSNLNNEDLYKNLNNWVLKYSKYVTIVTSDYDTANYTNTDINLNTLITFAGDNYYQAGLLSVKEAMLINQNTKESYLSNMLLANEDNLDNVWVINENGITSVDKNGIFNIKPVINIKADSLKGQGTKNNPYKI